MAGTGFDENLRSPKERPLFLIGAVFSGLVWLALLISIVGAFYGLIGLAFSLVVHALYLAHVRGNALRVSETQLPEIHAAVARSAGALGMPQLPEVYVAQAGGLLNAFATKFLSRKFVIIYSDLVDT
jgi:Zn-dependent protease with chaperone function